MNYNKNNGWYYINANQKSPSWTGVEFLFKFLTSNKGRGPKGELVGIDKLKFSHTLVVIKNGTNIYDTHVVAHTDDVFGKSIYEYSFKKYRSIHINFD